MALKKGQTANPNGRPKGATNKVTTDLRKAISGFLDKNWKTVQKDFDSMDAKDRLQFVDKMLAYSLPKLQAVQMDANVNTTLSKIDELNPDQVNEVFNLIMESK